MKKSAIKLSALIIFAIIFSSNCFSQSIKSIPSVGSDPLEAGVAPASAFQIQDQSLATTEAEPKKKEQEAVVAKKENFKETVAFDYKSTAASNENKINSTKAPYGNVAVK